jgi:hypothetical protein
VFFEAGGVGVNGPTPTRQSALSIADKNGGNLPTTKVRVANIFPVAIPKVACATPIPYTGGVRGGGGRYPLGKSFRHSASAAERWADASAICSGVGFCPDFSPSPIVCSKVHPCIPIRAASPARARIVAGSIGYRCLSGLIREGLYYRVQPRPQLRRDRPAAAVGAAGVGDAFFNLIFPDQGGRVEGLNPAGGRVVHGAGPPEFGGDFQGPGVGFPREAQALGGGGFGTPAGAGAGKEHCEQIRCD